MDSICLVLCMPAIVFILAILIFVELKQVEKFNQKIFSIGPRFIRVDLPWEVSHAIRQRSIEKIPTYHAEWHRVDDYTLLFYWSGRSEKRNPSLLSFKGRVFLHDEKPYAEGRLNIAALSFFIALGLMIFILSFTELKFEELPGKDLIYILGGSLAPFGFIVFSILIERGNFMEALSDIGVEVPKTSL